MFERLLAFYGLLTAPRSEERGVTATEYALIVAGIAVVVTVAIGAFGGQLSTFWNGLAAQLNITSTP